MFKKGFSLLELSISLIIIGLIFAGVTAGALMIKHMKLRALVAQFEEYESGINLFHLKYNSLPGDFIDADPLGIGTNGNGDGIISWEDEQYYFHAHLGNAKMIKGSYTGIGVGVSSDEPELGQNVANTKFSGVGLSVYNSTPYVGTAFYTLDYGKNMLSVGQPCLTCPLIKSTNANWFSPQDSSKFDAKFDDGLPGGGRILAMSGNNAINCAILVGNGYVYDTSISTTNCSIQLLFQ